MLIEATIVGGFLGPIIGLIPMMATPRHLGCGPDPPPSNITQVAIMKHDWTRCGISLGLVSVRLSCICWITAAPYVVHIATITRPVFRPGIGLVPMLAAMGHLCRAPSRPPHRKTELAIELGSRACCRGRILDAGQVDHLLLGCATNILVLAAPRCLCNVPWCCAQPRRSAIIGLGALIGAGSWLAGRGAA